MRAPTLAVALASPTGTQFIGNRRMDSFDTPPFKH
jgi:hypothetical protein